MFFLRFRGKGIIFKGNKNDGRFTRIISCIHDAIKKLAIQCITVQGDFLTMIQK